MQMTGDLVGKDIQGTQNMIGLVVETEVCRYEAEAPEEVHHYARWFLEGTFPEGGYH